ncbi:FxsA family membrane protein [Streptomyces sp. NPDC005318]|uniref:FxsA family membrane protein n=1 Tax=Streptomyces sp. NPDC005318 TaxID=3157031 RepID=UPI0033A0EF0C
MTTGTPPPTAPRRRSRARTFIPLAVAAWAVLEIWLLTVVADVASGFTVLLLLAGGVVLGAVVMKAAGRRAFRNLTETLQQMPGQPGAAAASPAAPAGSTGGKGNGFLMLGGLLIMIPGLISDVAGLLLLLPPVRKALGRFAEKTLDARMRAATPGSLSDAFQQARIHRPDGKVVQGEVIREQSPGRDETPRPPLTP